VPSRRKKAASAEVSDHLIPRVIAQIQSAMDDLAHNMMLQGKSQDFDKQQGVYLGLQQSIEIMKATIRDSERD
jgi:hypothetical protein